MEKSKRIRKMLQKLFFIITATFLFAAQSHAKRDVDSAIAKVNNRVITNFEVEDRYKFLVNFSKIKVRTKQDKRILINQIIDKMIDEELIRQEAKNRGIAISDVEINGVVEAIASKKKQSVKSFKRSFAKKNLSFVSYKKQIESDLIWSKIVSGSLKSKIKITDLEIKEFLEQQNQETDITKYKISELFIAKKDDAKILSEKLVQDLRSGADFSNFVKQFSQSPTAESAGEIGWVSKTDIHSKIYEEISSITKNSYTDPILLADGYYIFKLLDKKTVMEIGKDDRNFARNRIFMKELDVESKSYLMNLHKKSFVEIYRSKLSF